MLSGAKLVNKANEEVNLSEKTEIVLLYFSAHWCGPCRYFTPILRDFYEDVREGLGPDAVEVVFVSSDSDAQSASSYFHKDHGNWLQIAYDDPLRNELKRQTGVCAGAEMMEVGVPNRRQGIPGLCVLSKDRTKVVSIDGTEDVRNKGVNALKVWKKLM